MLQSSLKLTVLTPDRKLLSDAEVAEVFVPGHRGELNILPGHAPLMTTLETGVLRYRLKDSTQLKKLVVSWGYCQVGAAGVTVLAETAERAEEVDSERALAAWKLAQERLDSDALDPDAIEKYRRKLKRADFRRSVVLPKDKRETSH